MNFSRFFIDRPIFAGVIAAFITLIGAFSLPLLALAQYPEIAPPTVVIVATFPGASAETLAETISTPIEQEVNGVDRMLYMSSSSTSNGQVQITVTFLPRTDLDEARVQVQNRVALAEPRLPDAVRQIGVNVTKRSQDFLLIVALTSRDPTMDVDYIGNYANTVLRDRLLRIEGVGDVNVFGGGNYAMRVWVDPERAAQRNLTAEEIVAALRGQNVQVAAGSLGQPPFPSAPPAFQLPLQVQGRLFDPAQFADVVVKTDADGRITRIRDIGRVELGSQDYGINGYFDGVRGIALAIQQRPGSNALAAADRVIREMEGASADFPPGLSYSVPYNPTDYVAASVEEVEKTLIIAVLLVAGVVIMFLHTWRAAIIPIVAMPVALIGSFAFLLALGYSLNSLSLFGLVLAVGIVVDDAIVVVESVERHIRAGMAPRDAAVRTMEEVSGALVAIGLVLLAVFVPSAFLSGIPGQFYRQFAVTIASSTAISLLVSLTLSPALAALLLKPKRKEDEPRSGWRRPLQIASDKFNQAFDWLSNEYGKLTARLVRAAAVMLVIYVGFLAVTGWRLAATPTGFIPEQDQGYLIGVVQLPPGSSLERTDSATRRAIEIVHQTPGVLRSVAIVGLDGASFSAAPNAGTIFIRLIDFEQRTAPNMKAAALSRTLSQRMSAIAEGTILIIAPPPVRGLGTGGGFKMMVQDRSGAGLHALERQTVGMMIAAQDVREVSQVFTLFNNGSPRVAVDVDRDRAQLLGVQPEQVYDALNTYLGSTYVNDFNLFGRTLRVVVQAEPDLRDDLSDISNLKVRSATGEMVPIGSVATLRDDAGPARVVRYNLFPAAELQGATAQGVSTGTALEAMERLAARNLPEGFSFEWTETALQERQAGNTTGLVFGLAVVFVFLVLAAQYESFTLPLAVILIVPMCILAAMIGVGLRGQDNNILTQIGLIVLVALAAKNAILIVEFARQAEERGLDRFDAATEAAGVRLRPILMTSFAFIFGVLPLAIAVGPGAEMRQALGTAVFFGMIGVTAFGLIFTPVFYVVCRWIAINVLGVRPKTAAQAGEARP